MYLTIATRPDLSYAVSKLSQFNNNYTKEHWLAAKRVLRYLKGTINYGLKFKRTGDELVGYADADWGASTDDRRSYTGFMFTMAGACISWESRKQRTVALSSTEAEYMSLSETAKEALYLSRFITELGKPIRCITIFNDNQGAQRLSKNPSFHNRTKHIDIRYHFIREICEDGRIKLQYMPTTEMPADILTKALPYQKHHICRTRMGLHNLEI